MANTYRNVPKVHRLEYLEALLRSYAGTEFDEARARQRVQSEIQDFELRKARALRRQRPRVSEGAATLRECLNMALNLELIGPDRRLTPIAAGMCDPADRRRLLLHGMWRAYPRFRQVVLAVRDAGELDLPLRNWDEHRKRGGSLCGLEMDRRNFEVIRNFATQLGLVNWQPAESSRQIVYPAACVATCSEIVWIAAGGVSATSGLHDCRCAMGVASGLLEVDEDRYQLGSCPRTAAPDYIELQTDTETVLIRDHDVSIPDFEQCVWRQYLQLADLVPMSPVLYPSLRNAVCAALRVSDQLFDHHLISLINQPQRLSIHPSDGTLSYAANLAHIGKFLPPQTSEGNFIVYLKMERRSGP